METGKPIFGICLGHQILGLALGGDDRQDASGHHGANHPVKDLTTGKVEITSMNHGFAVETESLPAGVDPDPYLAVRRVERWTVGEGQADLFGAVPPRGVARPARQPLPVHALREPDPRAEGAAPRRRATPPAKIARPPQQGRPRRLVGDAAYIATAGPSRRVAADADRSFGLLLPIVVLLLRSDVGAGRHRPAGRTRLP